MKQNIYLKKNVWIYCYILYYIPIFDTLIYELLIKGWEVLKYTNWIEWKLPLNSKF